MNAKIMCSTMKMNYIITYEERNIELKEIVQTYEIEESIFVYGTL